MISGTCVTAPQTESVGRAGRGAPQRATATPRGPAATMAEDDEDFEEKLAYTFAQMGKGADAVNYMQLRRWISTQMKADEDVEGSGITDEMQKAATDSFSAHKRERDDMLGLKEVSDLLRELDLLKYMPDEIPEPEPEPVAEGLSAADLTKMLEDSHAESHGLRSEVKAATKEAKKAAGELEEMEEEVDDLTKELEAEKDAHTATKEGLVEEAEAHKAAKADAESQLEALGKQTEALEKEVEAHTATKAELDAAKTSHEEAAAAASTELESVMEEVRKTHLLRHFVPTMIILPRQARDKHRKNSKRDAFFAGDG